MCVELRPKSPGAAYNRVRLINGMLRYKLFLILGYSYPFVVSISAVKHVYSYFMRYDDLPIF